MRRRKPFDDWFRDIDEEFERIREQMERIMGRAFSSPEEKQFVYGFSVRTGPNGKPQIQEFGDTRIPFLHEMEKGREPLTDVIEREDAVSITLEMPGVEKEDIDLRTTERGIKVRVDTEDRRYYKEIDFPCPVDVNSIKATFKNGVLDLTFKKIKKDEGKKVRIE